ncbi:hypothetical protein V5T82_10685 [Magnetovibrio sp. PR-2]|uniref:hypothetical protein n=1 Tax=Magnetovibrio sp. PR-2 TaxID=3120356 RepID=UPI002FCE3EEB
MGQGTPRPEYDYVRSRNDQKKINNINKMLRESRSSAVLDGEEAFDELREKYAALTSVPSLK